MIITIINIVGGLIMGMTTMGLSAGEALQKFTILTIGDGLVSQIPSMLISIATGILVTKSAGATNIGDTMITNHIIKQDRIILYFDYSLYFYIPLELTFLE
mgnify:CR=1 FL=1